MIFLSLKLNEILKKFKVIFKCENNIHGYLNCLFIISFLKFKFATSVVYSHVFIVWGLAIIINLVKTVLE